MYSPRYNIYFLYFLRLIRFKNNIWNCIPKYLFMYIFIQLFIIWLYVALLFTCEKELENIFGDCNCADELNSGEIAMRGEGTLVWLLEAANGLMMLSVSSGGTLNPILEDTLSRLDLCSDWLSVDKLVWGKIWLIGLRPLSGCSRMARIVSSQSLILEGVQNIIFDGRGKPEMSRNTQKLKQKE